MLDAQESKLLDLAEVTDRTRLSRSTIYNYINAGLFPRPRKLGVSPGQREIEAWISERPAA